MNLRLLKLANSGFLLAKLSGIDLFENVVDSPKGHGCVSNFMVVRLSYKMFYLAFLALKLTFIGQTDNHIDWGTFMK